MLVSERYLCDSIHDSSIHWLQGAEMENSTVAAAEAAAPSMTFVKLCLLWTALHKGPAINDVRT